jgi:DNA-binding transcriptional LysR family regulator
VAEISDLFSLLQLVRAGVGAALVPSAAAAMRVPGVRMKRLDLVAAAWDIDLARKKQDKGPLVDAFVRVAREVSSERAR